MSASKSSPARTAVTVLMDVLVAVAVAALAQLVISFFGVMSSAPWGISLLRVTRYVVLPLALAPIATPYAGIFDGNAAVTVLALLGVEWALGLARRNV
ncbi:MAG: hypothetical protein Q7W16_07435 [Coriobacteriia bacterium]|nr:hypothetical protein [Coriobacteriia bacterium]